MQQEYKPLDLGNIIDTGWRIYKKNFYTLFSIMAIAYLPTAILSFLLNFKLVQMGETEDPGVLLTILLISIPLVLLYIVLYPLSTGATIKVASEDFINNDISFNEAYKYSYKKFFALLVPLVFAWLAVAVGSFIGLIGLIIGSPITYIFLSTIFIFIPQAVIVDDKDYFDAMGRSAKLVMADFWRVLGIRIVIWIISIFAGLIVNIPGFLPYFVLGETSLVGQLFYHIFAFLATVLIGPYTLTVLTVLFYDLKIRQEDFGLPILDGSPVENNENILSEENTSDNREDNKVDRRGEEQE